MRHLPLVSVSEALRRGQSVEQFLGRTPDLSGGVHIRWVELRPTERSIEVWVHDVEDIGNEDLLDLYSFPYLDPDVTDPAAAFHDSDAALAYVMETLAIASSRWVNQFLLQDEYLDYVRSGRPARWPVSAA